MFKSLCSKRAVDLECISACKTLKESSSRRGQCRVKELWRLNCEQLEEHDLIVSAKEEEIESLKARLQGVEVNRRAPGWSLPTVTELPGEPVQM